MFTTPGLSDYISGAILFEETLFQSDPSAGRPRGARCPENGGCVCDLLLELLKRGRQVIAYAKGVYLSVWTVLARSN